MDVAIASLFLLPFGEGFSIFEVLNQPISVIYLKEAQILPTLLVNMVVNLYLYNFYHHHFWESHREIHQTFTRRHRRIGSFDRLPITRHANGRPSR